MKSCLNVGIRSCCNVYKRYFKREKERKVSEKREEEPKRSKDTGKDDKERREARRQGKKREGNVNLENDLLSASVETSPSQLHGFQSSCGNIRDR